MEILLAPMEGLLDYTLRDVLTRLGGVDRCVSEFIRITDMLLPERVFTRIMPELHNGGRTPSGVPVRGQLLGSDAACMADNAARLASLGPAGIDINFGCPAKIVNRRGGGAMLLQTPEVLSDIVSAVRRAVPAHMPVSAKMRLGYLDDSRAEECAIAIAEGGASEIVIHARTKADAYRPPAFWHRIADVKAVVNIPLIANGEIWTLDDAMRCQRESGCDSLMLGRGMVADPGLALAILAAHPKSNQGLAPHQGPVSWADIRPLLWVYWERVKGHVEPRHRAGRIKQWLNFLRRRHHEAEAVYQQLRTLNDSREVEDWLQANCAAPEASPIAPRAAPVQDQADF